MPLIARAKDANKDQTYFIWQIKREQLPYILFPVGEFDVKSDVREFAESRGLITSNKPDSQGLCFVGQTSLRDMLLQTLGRKDGFIYSYLSQEQIDKIGLKVTKKTRGEVNILGQFKIELGPHEGAFLYTIGQRQNLGISNGPWFVTDVDIINNEVIVCHQEFQESIMSQYLLIKDLNWHLDIVKESTYTKLKVVTNQSEKLEVKNILDELRLADFDMDVILNLIQNLKNVESKNSKELDLRQTTKVTPVSLETASPLTSGNLTHLNLKDNSISHYNIHELQFKAQIRYRSEAKNCKVYLIENFGLENPPKGIFRYAQDDEIVGMDLESKKSTTSFAIIKFDEPIKAAAKGQSIVFYDIDTDQYLLGGGVIDKVLK